MPVFGCSNCSSLISLSLIPGGNPAAEGDEFARNWRICDRCGSLLCEECAPASETQCNCGGLLNEPDSDTRMKLYFPKCESLEDLPPSLRRLTTKRERMEKLNEQWERGILARGEYDAYKSILEASA
ncbi:hypothetical protein Pan181_50580 [Aeoliella mucimassa]|uniref:Uncharacterized protein n=1 Tax=Aeoliella mucimassa TaxID=2527972 RepID=A0A518AVS0_9BACT|nr:hypothetical protein Pan181_50580 [Aeoliella mucimassa]